LLIGLVADDAETPIWFFSSSSHEFFSRFESHTSSVCSLVEIKKMETKQDGVRKKRKATSSPTTDDCCPAAATHNKRKRVKPERLGGNVAFLKQYPTENTWIAYIPDFFTKQEADAYLEHMMDEKQVKFADEKSFYGNPPARQCKWFGDFTYTYSKTSKHLPCQTPDWLSIVARKVEEVTHAIMKSAASPKEEKQDPPRPKFTGILSNLYRTGRDSVSRHPDQEDVLAPGIPIASLSVGAEREFKMWPNVTGSHASLYITLAHGSLLIMGGDCQKHWEHAVEKDEDVKEARVNSTFRQYVHS